MASMEAVLNRRANRKAAREAKERKTRSRTAAALSTVAAEPTVEAVAPVPAKRKSGGRRLRERAAWERAVAERMAIRLDPRGEVLEIFRIDYRYWECRAAGFDPEAKVIGYRNGVGKLVGGNVLRSHRFGVVRDAIVYDWWWELDPQIRNLLRIEGRKERARRGRDFTQSIF